MALHTEGLSSCYSPACSKGKDDTEGNDGWEECSMVGGKGTEKGLGRTSQANQIVVGRDVPLPIPCLSEGVAPLWSSFPWPAWLAAQEALDQLVAGSLEKGNDEKRGPSPQVEGCVDGQTTVPLAPCFHSIIFLYQYPQGSPNLLTYSTWLLLAAPTHKCCFRIKELGTIETGSGPADRSARPVKTVCRSLGARGPSASCHPIQTRWIAQVGPYDHEGTFQGHWVEWAGPSTSLAPDPSASTTQFCLCGIHCPAHPPLSPVLHSHFSPWLLRASCDSRISAKQFPRDGETALHPWAPPPLLSGSTPLLGSSTGSSCVLQNSLWITSVIASRCGPQKHKGAVSSSFNFFFFVTCMGLTTPRCP